MTDSPGPDETSQPFRILLVDDNRLMLEGLVNLLAAYGFEVVGTASDGLAAVALTEELHPDLILMDVRMPRCDGLEATRHIKASQPGIKIVMLTTSAEDSDLFEAVRSGATGYLIKSITGDAFIEALRGLEQGTPPFSPGLALRLLSEFARMAEGEKSKGEGHEQGARVRGGGESAERDQLTDRQIEVLRLVASGLTYKEVGSRMALSERTVRYHMAELMERLHLKHRSEVISYAGKRDWEGLDKK